MLALPLGAAFAWLQLWVALALGTLEFDRRFDAGTDDDWLVNLRLLALFCATSVVLAVLLTQMVLRRRETSRGRRALTGLVAAAGACTVWPYVMSLAAKAEAVHLVGQRPVPSAVQAVIAGVGLGWVTAQLAGVRGASARGVLSGVLIGSGVWWAGAFAGSFGEGWGYGRRTLLTLAFAALGPVVVAVLAAIATRRHNRVTTWLACLITVADVVAVLVLIWLIAPAPTSGTGLELLAPLSFGVAAALAVLLVSDIRGDRRQGAVAIEVNGPPR